jgi:hypothetical protein
MSPQAYEYLLVAANLAHFHTKWGFSTKKRKWDLYIEGHQFSSRHCMGTFEIDSKTIDLKFVYQWSVSSAQGKETIYLDWHNQRLLSQKN